MKITIVEPNQDEEEEVIIKCHHLDEWLVNLINHFKMQQHKLSALQNGNIYFIAPEDVYYFESVDNKVFIYCQEQVYESKFKLYELEEVYSHTDYFRASKSIILNLSKIKHLSPAFNGRFEALLLNNERIIISRQYVPELKKKLGL